MRLVSNFPIADAGLNLGNSVIHGLAVAGGGAVGYLLMFLFLWSVGKFVFHKQVPLQLRRMICLLAAVATAILIWIMLFNSASGGGWGLGPGLGLGSGTDAHRDRFPTDLERVIIATNTSDAKNSADGSAAPLRILMLGGDKVSGSSENELAYYQVLPADKAYNLKEIKELIRQRMTETPVLRGIAIIIRNDSVDHNHAAVKRLEEYAKGEGLAISYPTE